MARKLTIPARNAMEVVKPHHRSYVCASCPSCVCRFLFVRISGQFFSFSQPRPTRFSPQRHTLNARTLFVVHFCASVVADIIIIIVQLNTPLLYTQTVRPQHPSGGLCHSKQNHRPPSRTFLLSAPAALRKITFTCMETRREYHT